MKHFEKGMDRITPSSEVAIENYRIAAEPHYLTTGDEIEVFESAYRLNLPVMLKGPTG